MFTLAAVSVGLPLLMGIVGVEDRFYARNVIVAVPSLAALAAPATLRMRALPLAAYPALALFASLWVATSWRYEQADWRDAIARVETADPQAPLIAITRSAAPVVRTYLGRGESSPAGLVTKSQRGSWLNRPVARTIAHFVPAPVPAIPGFFKVRELRAYAFRLILIAASLPMRIISGAIPHSTVFPAAHDREPARAPVVPATPAAALCA